MYSIRRKPLYIIASVATFLFAGLALAVSNGATLEADRAVLHAVSQLSSPAFDTFFVFVAQLGGVVFVSGVTAALFLFCLYKSKYTHAGIVAGGVGGAALLGLLLKSLFERPRPDLWDWIVHESYFSFPSGHTVAVTALAAVILFLVWRTRWRVTALVVMSVYLILVGFSRLYLGVHYPSDVIGAGLVSIAWVSLLVVIVNTYLPAKRVR